MKLIELKITKEQYYTYGIHARIGITLLRFLGVLGIVWGDPFEDVKDFCDAKEIQSHNENSE